MRSFVVVMIAAALLSGCTQTNVPATMSAPEASPIAQDTVAAVVTLLPTDPPTADVNENAEATLTSTPVVTSTSQNVVTNGQRILLPNVSTGNATSAPATSPPVLTAPATATSEPLARLNLSAQGINVADYADANLKRIADLKFGWIQVFSAPEYPIQGYKILYRVPLGAAISGQQADIDAFGEQLENLARERAGVINAYSIGNEVNLAREWGGRPPDPALYTRLLAVAYARIKTGDPEALVISSGIAPTGGDSAGAMDDLAYARAMFEAGALDVMDAYSFHAYGFAYEPERDPADAQTRGLLFRRAEAHRKLMEEFGGANKALWATEFGWIIDANEEGSGCTFDGLDWQRVSRDKQAAYVVRAYDFASKNWPWMGPMFLWNYDFSRSPLYPDACEQMKWFSLLDAQGNERPVLSALRAAAQ